MKNRLAQLSRRLVRWLELRSLTSQWESLCSAYQAECEELSSLQKTKARARWLCTPTLDARINASRQEATQLYLAMNGLQEQIKARRAPHENEAEHVCPR